MGRKKRKAGGGNGFLQFLPVLAVVVAMGFDYYATVFVFLDHWIAGGVQSDQGLLHAGLFTWTTFMCSISFFVAAVSDPGSVPVNYGPDAENPQKEGTKSRSCEKCDAYKPPRSHHCRVCKRCVLKMDHHCLWMNNCVGYSNYKPFFIFILHAAIGSLYSTVIFFCDLFQTNHDFGVRSTTLFYVLSGCLLFFLSLTMNTLLGWHIYLLTKNMTTIEFRAFLRDKWLAEKSGQKYRHRFDIGLCNNISQVLGPNILKWLCPTSMGHLRDGTQFPVSSD
ncbi:putative protein S-acyltransferase 15 isoform X2 [Carex littledalei]|uniref:S-acyltransferase n=1 Tax=Carex littledalei TaxID=544730 RepID=A0A833UXR6_9POAL|nr:putative protein S-acyltransferase 15 isoform X2 [Carex littledalei]